MNGLPHLTTRLPGATGSRNSGVIVEIEVVYPVVKIRVCNITLFSNVKWMVFFGMSYCFQMFVATDAF
jgi:uncharacterized membrane protein YccF (DUF307 family)